MSWYSEDAVFLNNMSGELSRLLRAKVNIYKTAAPMDDPFNVGYVVAWTWPVTNQEYKILIHNDEIGPSRQFDLVKAFKKAIRTEYPELLL